MKQLYLSCNVDLVLLSLITTCITCRVIKNELGNSMYINGITIYGGQEKILRWHKLEAIRCVLSPRSAHFATTTFTMTSLFWSLATFRLIALPYTNRRLLFASAAWVGAAIQPHWLQAGHYDIIFGSHLPLFSFYTSLLMHSSWWGKEIYDYTSAGGVEINNDGGYVTIFYHLKVLRNTKLKENVWQPRGNKLCFKQQWINLLLQDWWLYESTLLEMISHQTNVHGSQKTN